MTTAVTTRSESLRVARSLARCLRPHQWVKNFLVFGGLLFSQRLADPVAVLHSVHAFLLFCFAASSIYLLNDVQDRDEDRLHPEKRLRPIASGEVSSAAAIAAMLVLAIGSLGSSFMINRSFGVLLCLYFAMNVAYTVKLKHVVILDVMLIAFGFVLRAVGGAIAIGQPASSWLILCTMTLALLVGFGKRRNEIAVLQGNAANHRSNLDEYSLPFLDVMMTISAAAAVIMYTLYAAAAAHFRKDHAPMLVLTTPSGGGDPSKLFVSDKPFLINGVLWVLACCAAIYGPSHWAIW
ncbi:MAG: UbiA prenyltransferase [Planctomycetota bacterium]|nr:MAG: UbiA prenyltransferase [Planctomycetota bacterium]